jgi:hypothetical protein
MGSLRSLHVPRTDPEVHKRNLNIQRTDHEVNRLTREIAWYEEETRKNLGLLLQYRLEIGKRLAQARELLPHGQFLAWAEREFGWTARHVQNHLTLAANAKHVSRLEPGASLRMALAAIKEVHLEARKRTDPVEILPPVRRIHLTGEIHEGTLDCERLLAEMQCIAAAFGASKTVWKAR